MKKEKFGPSLKNIKEYAKNINTLEFTLALQLKDWTDRPYTLAMWQYNMGNRRRTLTSPPSRSPCMKTTK